MRIAQKIIRPFASSESRVKCLKLVTPRKYIKYSDESNKLSG